MNFNGFFVRQWGFRASVSVGFSGSCMGFLAQWGFGAVNGVFVFFLLFLSLDDTIDRKRRHA